jgi:hypothetical protein
LGQEIVQSPQPLHRSLSISILAITQAFNTNKEKITYLWQKLKIRALYLTLELTLLFSNDIVPYRSRKISVNIILTKS